MKGLATDESHIVPTATVDDANLSLDDEDAIDNGGDGNPTVVIPQLPNRGLKPERMLFVRLMCTSTPGLSGQRGTGGDCCCCVEFGLVVE